MAEVTDYERRAQVQRDRDREATRRKGEPHPVQPDLRAAAQRVVWMVENDRAVPDKRPVTGEFQDDIIALARALASPPSATEPGLPLADLHAADMAASLVHDYIWQKPVLSDTEPPSKEQASDAIWTIHNVLRQLLAASPEPVAEPAGLRTATPGDPRGHRAYVQTWQRWEAFEAAAAKRGSGATQGQMTGAAMMLGWLFDHDILRASPESDVEDVLRQMRAYAYGMTMASPEVVRDWADAMAAAASPEPVEGPRP